MRGRRNTTQKREKKTAAQNSSRVHCATKISRVHLPWKKHQRPFLSTLSTRQRKRKKWSRLPKVRALYTFPLALFLSFSLSLLFPRCCAFFAFEYSFSLSPFALRLCARVCVSRERPLIFVSEFCFHLNHKFSSRALTYWRFLSLSSHHLFIQFAASAPATSADRPWPWSRWSARTSR